MILKEGRNIAKINVFLDLNIKSEMFFGLAFVLYFFKLADGKGF